MGCNGAGESGSLVPVSKIAFWFGVMLFVLGSIISFYPGVEARWYAITAAFVGFGLFVPAKTYRVATLLIVGVCLIGVCDGYQRGMEYQEWLRTRQP